ncbi:hypothetical protein BDZ89DRAFT_506632 [Hymenopellis radicata]|nr:hypothetical protein BDZ89DRAFT_506632 [Hymenopellis radicata]
MLNSVRHAPSLLYSLSRNPSQTSTPGRGRVAVREVHVGGAREHGGDDHKRHPANAEHAFSHTTTTSTILLSVALDFDSELNVNVELLALSGCHSDASMCWGTTPRRRGDYSLFPCEHHPVVRTSFSAPASTFTLQLDLHRGIRCPVARISRILQRLAGSVDPEPPISGPRRPAGEATSRGDYPHQLVCSLAAPSSTYCCLPTAMLCSQGQFLR